MTRWTGQLSHQHWLRAEAFRLLDFGRVAVPNDRGAGWLDDDGVIDGTQPVQTWVTARMAHVFSLGHLMGVPGSRAVATRALDALLRARPGLLEIDLGRRFQEGAVTRGRVTRKHRGQLYRELWRVRSQLREQRCAIGFGQFEHTIEQRRQRAPALRI